MAPRVRRVVDLTVPLDATTQVYPGDPAVTFESVATVREHGFNLLGVQMGSQSGTNCDAPLHVIDGAAPIDATDLTLWVGPAKVIDVTGLAPRTAIRADLIAPQLDGVPPGTIALLHTGWDVHWRTPTFLDHPYLDPAAATLMLDHDIRTFALDAMNIDETPLDDGPVALPCHHLIAERGGVIVENLTNLGAIDFDPFVVMLPLRLTGADGSPTRAVALDLA